MWPKWYCISFHHFLFALRTTNVASFESFQKVFEELKRVLVMLTKT